MDFYYYTFTYFVPIGVINDRVTKINSKYFNGKLWPFYCSGWSILFSYAPGHKALLVEMFLLQQDGSSYSFKINCILLRQLISLKKMVVPSAKFAILISWSPIYIPLFRLLTPMKLASTSAAILYNGIESGHLSQTPRIMVKGSDRRPAILI